MKTTLKRYISLLLAVVFCLSLLPSAALADGEPGAETPAAEAAQSPEPEPEPTPAAVESVPEETAAPAGEETARSPEPEQTPVPETTELPGEPSADEETVTEEIIAGEPETVYFTDLPDNEELFEGYADQILYDSGISLYAQHMAGDRLEGLNKKIYDSLKDYITQVAAGQKTSTEVTVRAADLGIADRRWTAEELGVPIYEQDSQGKTFISTAAANKISEELECDLQQVLYALQEDCPYRLYWLDVSRGITRVVFYSLTNVTTEDGITERALGVNNMRFDFYVAAAFSATGESGTRTVDTDKMAGAQTARENAQAIVAKYSGLSDYEKLVAYRREICALASYVTATASGSGLLGIFGTEGETAATSVGYAKAFKYLCDLTEFTGDVYCHTVQGQTNLNSNYTWNIVTMADGRHYIADIAACDRAADASGLVFLSGGNGSVDDGYTVSIGDSSMTYRYDSATRSLLEDGELTVQAEPYAFVEDGMVYQTDGGKTAIIGWESGLADELVIPVTVRDVPVTAIAAGAFRNAGLVSVEIPDNIKTIGAGAFSGCTSLKTIVFDGGAPTMSGTPFDGVTASAGYYADSTWTEAARESAGGSITWLATLKSADGKVVAKYKEGQIWSDSAAISVGPTDVKNNGAVLAAMSEKMKDVAEGYTLKYEGFTVNLTGEDEALLNAVILLDVEGPAGYGENSTLYHFDTATEKLIEMDAATLADGRWSMEVQGLGLFVVAEEIEMTETPEEYIYSEGGIVYRITANSATVIGHNSTLPEMVTIPVTVKDVSVMAIAAGAFQNAGLKSVEIPDNIKIIGEQAFSGCASLTDIRFTGAGPDSIADSAFAGTAGKITVTYTANGFGAVAGKSYGGDLDWVGTLNGQTENVTAIYLPNAEGARPVWSGDERLTVAPAETVSQEVKDSFEKLADAQVTETNGAETLVYTAWMVATGAVENAVARITAPLPKGYTKSALVYVVTADNSLEKVESTADNGQLTFDAPNPNGQYIITHPIDRRVVVAESTTAAIVAKYAGLNDYNKLAAYRREICALASHDEALAADFAAGDGVLNVLGLEGEMAVPSAGYAEAFQALCAATTFTNTGITCQTVTGTKDGAAHTWNVVTLGGENYIVDVAGCDGGETPMPFLTGESEQYVGGSEVTIAAADYAVIENGVVYRVGDTAMAIGWEDGLPETVTIPAKVNEKAVTAIGEKAFQNAALTAVNFPQTSIAIGAEAFSGCTVLTTLIFPGNAPAIGNNAFAGVETLEMVYTVDESWSTALTGSNYGAEIDWLGTLKTADGAVTAVYNPNESDGLYPVWSGNAKLSAATFTVEDADTLSALEALRPTDEKRTIKYEAFDFELTGDTMPAGSTVSVAMPVPEDFYTTELYDCAVYRVVEEAAEGGKKLELIDSWAEGREISFDTDSLDDAYILAAEVVKPVDNAAEAIKAITEQYTGLNDYNKLAAYCRELCALARPAQEGETAVDGDGILTNYGKTVEAITNAAGYAEAFAKLCQASGFTCQAITGTKDGTDYTWNAVTLEGGNYIVDAVGCDIEMANSPAIPFLVGNGNGAYTLPEGSELSISDTDYAVVQDFVAYRVAGEGMTVIGHIQAFRPSSMEEGEQKDGYEKSTAIVIASAVNGTNVTAIGDGAFKGMTELESVENHAALTAIGAEAFAGCENLVTVDSDTAGASIAEIGQSAFAGCLLLTDIHLPHQEKPTIADDAFTGVEDAEIFYYVDESWDVSGASYGGTLAWRGTLEGENISAVYIDNNTWRNTATLTMTPAAITDEATLAAITELTRQMESDTGDVYTLKYIAYNITLEGDTIAEGTTVRTSLTLPGDFRTGTGYACGLYRVGADGTLTAVESATRGNTLDFTDSTLAGQYIITARMDKRIVVAENTTAAIVEQYAGLNDYNKLAAYRREICARASYDAAAESEGFLDVLGKAEILPAASANYAAAFQALCDKGGITCQTVTGAKNGAAYTWNVVTLDGANYIADVAACDSTEISAMSFLIGNSEQYASDGELSISDTDYAVIEKGVAYHVAENSATVAGWEDDLPTAVEIADQIGNASVEAVAEKALLGRETITSLTVGAAVKTIGAQAFSGCTALKNIAFEGGVPNVGENAFEGVADATATYYVGRGWTADNRTAVGGTNIVTWNATLVSGDIIARYSDGGEWDEDAVMTMTSATVDMATLVALVKTMKTAANDTEVAYSAFTLAMATGTLKEDTAVELDITVPAGYNADCKLYPVNTDGSVGDEVSVIYENGRLRFTTQSLGTYIAVGLDSAEGSKLQVSNGLICSGTTVVGYTANLPKTVTLPESVTAIADDAFSGVTALMVTYTAGDNVTGLAGQNYGANGIDWVGTLIDETKNVSAVYNKPDTGARPIWASDAKLMAAGETVSADVIAFLSGELTQTENGKLFKYARYNIQLNRALAGDAQITLTLPEGYGDTTKLYRVTEAEGQLTALTDMNAAYSEGKLSFTTNTLGSYVLLDETTTTEGLGGHVLVDDGLIYHVTADSKTAVGYTKNLPETVTFPETVTAIGADAFRDAAMTMTSVTIPETVTSIGDGAFAGCGGLKNIAFAGGVETLGENIFDGVTATASYYVGKGWTAEKRNSAGGTITWSATLVSGDITARYSDSGAWDETAQITITDTDEADSAAIFAGIGQNLKQTKDGAAFTYSAFAINLEGSENRADSESVTLKLDIPAPEGHETSDIYYIGETVEAVMPTKENGRWQMEIPSFGVIAMVDALASTEDASDYIYTEGGLVYHITAESAAIIGCTDDLPAKITLPETVQGVPVNAIGRNAFQNAALTDVTFPENITAIGGSAFSGCAVLTDIRFTGAAPAIIAEDTFAGTTGKITVTYTVDESWSTSIAGRSYGGTLDWVGTLKAADGSVTAVYLPDAESSRPVWTGAGTLTMTRVEEPDDATQNAAATLEDEAYNLEYTAYDIALAGEELAADATVTLSIVPPAYDGGIVKYYQLKDDALTPLEAQQNGRVSFDVQSLGLIVVTRQTAKVHQRGDIDGDTLVNMSDAMRVAQYLVGLPTILGEEDREPSTDEQSAARTAADVDLSGEINGLDAVFIAQLAVGGITQEQLAERYPETNIENPDTPAA